MRAHDRAGLLVLTFLAAPHALGEPVAAGLLRKAGAQPPAEPASG